MNFMDFPSAVDEILAIQKKCESLRMEADEIAKRTEKVSIFLCTLIGRTGGKKDTQNQDIVSTNEENHNGTWKDILIDDLKRNGKSYTSDILERVCVIKNITDKDEKKSTLNSLRTSLARFRQEGLVKSQEDGQRMIWDIS
jgi:hypothetical protein